MPFRPIKRTTAPAVEPSFLDRIGGIPGLFAAGTRAVTGVTSAMGGPLGALISGGGELGAEALEGSLAGQTPARTAARVGAASAIGAVPFGAVLKAGRPLASAARGALYSGGGEALRELAATDTVDPETAIKSGLTGGAITGGLSYLMKLFKGKPPVPAPKPAFTSPPVIGEEAGTFQYRVPPRPARMVHQPTPVEANKFQQDVRTSIEAGLRDADTAKSRLKDLDAAIKATKREASLTRAASGRTETRAVQQETSAELAQLRQEIKAANEATKAGLISDAIEERGLEAGKPSISRGVSAKTEEGTLSMRTPFRKPKPARGTSGWREEGEAGSVSDLEDMLTGKPSGAVKPPATGGLPPEGTYARVLYNREIANGVSPSAAIIRTEETIYNTARKLGVDPKELALKPVSPSAAPKVEAPVSPVKAAPIARPEPKPVEPVVPAPVKSITFAEFERLPREERITFPEDIPIVNESGVRLSKGYALTKIAMNPEAPMAAAVKPVVATLHKNPDFPGVGRQWDIELPGGGKTTVTAKTAVERYGATNISAEELALDAELRTAVLPELTKAVGVPAEGNIPRLRARAPELEIKDTGELSDLLKGISKGTTRRGGTAAPVTPVTPKVEVPPTAPAAAARPPEFDQYPPEVVAELDKLGPQYRAAQGAEKRGLGAQLSEIRDFMSGKKMRDSWRGASEKGAIDPMLLARLGLGAGGALIGAATDPLENPLASAVAGGVAGALAPSVIPMLAKMGANPNVLQNLEQKIQSPGGIRTAASDIWRTLPQIQRFNYLTNLHGLTANAVFGPYGSAVMGAIEAGLSGDPRGWALLKTLTPKAFLKEMTAKANRLEAAELIMHGELGRAENLRIGKGSPKFQRAMAAPGYAMTMGDTAARKMIQRAGFSEAEARRMTLTSEPELPAGKEMVRLGKSSVLMNLLAPFRRTPTNIAEQGFMRLPGVGALIQGTRANPDPIRQQLIQQGIMTPAVTGLSGAIASQLDPETAKIVRRYVTNFGGVYSLPAAVGFAGGQAIHAGQPAVSARNIMPAIEALPLPTTDTISGMAKFLLEPKGRNIPAGAVPKDLKDWLFPPVKSTNLPGVPRLPRIKSR